MTIEALTLLSIGIPVVGAFTIPLVGRIAVRLRAGWAVLIGAATAVCTLLLIPLVWDGGTQTIRYAVYPNLDFILTVDGLAVFMAVVSSSVGALILLYSVGYIRHEENQSEYYLMFILFIGSMMGLVFSSHLLYLYVFWEITAICSWRLIGFYRKPDFVRKADKAFLFTFGSAVIMLVGFLLIYNQTGTFDLTAMHGVTVASEVVLLILVGILAKSATVPLHTWLPDAGIAPSTVTSLLHAAVLVKIGVYAYARLFVATFVLPAGWETAIPILVMVSSLIASCAAVVENDMKRILAYSTVGQIGYIFLGLSVGNPIGIAGALLFILMHGLGKAGLFLCAGIIEHGTHKRDIREVGGLIRTMPITAVSFLLCAFSVMGLPPLGGFFSKFMVISGTVQAGHVWVAAAALLIAVLTVFYLFRLFNALFLGEPKNSGKEGTHSMVFVVAGLAVLSILAGLFIAFPMDLANTATLQMMGRLP